MKGPIRLQDYEAIIKGPIREQGYDHVIIKVAKLYWLENFGFFSFLFPPDFGNPPTWDFGEAR